MTLYFPSLWPNVPQSELIAPFKCSGDSHSLADPLVFAFNPCTIVVFTDAWAPDILGLEVNKKNKKIDENGKESDDLEFEDHDTLPEWVVRPRDYDFIPNLAPIWDEKNKVPMGYSYHYGISTNILIL